VNQLADLIGSSPAIEGVRDQIRRLVAHQQAGHRLPSVLIAGETGTGKGLVALLLHQSSSRASGPFVPINCAAIPDTLLEAELFGYERGAFTDARQAKAGLFQTAHHGTIFLDEVALLPEALQAKLLKALEERAVRRLGGTRSEPFDAWVLSATNADLTVELRERRFREDLYHRLAVLTLHLPPIRERGEDVVVLAEHFLARACADYGLSPKTISPAARTQLAAFPWPGNVRQLANVMERVALLGDAREVTPAMLALPSASSIRAAPAAADGPGTKSMGATTMRSHLLGVLEQHRWNISHTAVALRITRNTLRAWMEKYGLREGTRAARSPAASRTEAAEAKTVAEAPALPPAPERPTPSVPIEHRPTSAPAFVTEPASTKIRWERRQLVLLRLVLPGPSGLDSLHDTSPLLEALIDKVRSFGGRIEELSPTSLGAVFGMEMMEEASRRAAHAVMAMQRLLERGRHGEGAGVTARAGIHAAVLMVGQAGDVQHLDADARRAAWAALDPLVSAGPPGGVVVTAAAAPLLQRRFVLTAPAAPAPGTEGAFQLVGSERAAIRAIGRLTGFVGRQQDLDLLESRFQAATKGRGQVFAISGEAGIGKSRLLHEFRQRIRGHRVTYLEAHCISYGTAIPYLPILELLRRAFRLDDADPPPLVASKIRRVLDRFGLPGEQAVPSLLELLGIKKSEEAPAPGPEVIQARIRDIIRHLSVSASRRRPLIVVVEDLHWIDAASEALGLSLLHGIDTLPIFVLLTYRAGYRQPWMDRSYVTQIALPPLSREHSAGIVRAVLDPDVPPALTDLIVDRAEGNPFFLEELAYVVAEQHDLGEPRAVPETIQEVLLARINRLTAGARHVLETAAIFGRSVSHRLLSAAWTGPEPIADLLRDLVRQEFLYETTSAAGETEYVFHHALTQESAYQNLVESTRRRLHGAAGQALEQLYAGRLEEVVELLAHHYGRSTLDERAVDYGILAAEKAARRWANIEARTAFTTVLGRLDQMPRSQENLLRRLDAVLKQSEIRFALGEHRAQLQGLAAIRDIVEQIADPARRAAWLYWSGFLHSLVGDRPEIAIGYGQEAATLVAGAGFEGLRPFADCCLAHAYALAGDLREAMSAGERALSQFEARGDVWWACRTMWILSHTANALGEWGRSLDYCGRALYHGEAADDLRLKVVAWSRMAASQVQKGDAKAALASCDAATKIGPTPFDTANLNAVRGYALVKVGDAAAGLRLLHEAVQWFAGTHLLYNRSTCSGWLAESLVRSGDREAGRTVAAAVLATSESVGYRLVQGVAHRVLGESFMPDDAGAAAAHLQKARSIFEQIVARNDLAKTLVAQAAVHATRGESDQARLFLNEAARIFEALGTTDEPDRVRAALRMLPGGADTSAPVGASG
jgi:transcriptional regulator with AAA-type ATPase domain/tetratricopeptide (TPR) repeat protein